MIFVDGSNLYHGLKRLNVVNRGQLSFSKIAKKLVGPREWVELRYYVGQVQQSGNTDLYAQQRSFVARQMGSDGRISFHFGRLEKRTTRNDGARELLDYVAASNSLSPHVRKELQDIGKRHQEAQFLVEKAVDVALAVDLVACAANDKFDTAYLVSADGDFTHAVSYVRGLGKRVFAVAASAAHQLQQVSNHLITLSADWVKDCYFDS